MIPQQPLQVMPEPGLKRWDKIAAQLAVQNIASWFNEVSADELSQYAVTNADLSQMLPMTLNMPTIVYRIARYPLLMYLKGVVNGGPRKAILYEEVRRMLADPRLFGYRFFDHCLLLAWGLYHPDSPVQKRQLQRFPCLTGTSSVQPWYHANMDKVVLRIIHQLEHGTQQGGDNHDARNADGVDSGGRGVADSGGDVPGMVLREEEGTSLDDLSFAIPDDFCRGPKDPYSD